MELKMSVEQFEVKMVGFKHLLVSLTELSAIVKPYLTKLTEVSDEIKSLQAITNDLPLRSVLASLALNLVATYFPHSEAKVLIDSATFTILDFEVLNELRIEIDRIMQQYLPSKTILNENVKLYAARLKAVVEAFYRTFTDQDAPTPFAP
jgi:hypothetical protein